jgi:zona occludens toxin
MAITAYTGLPRNGKSYGVVENVILPAIQQGRTVFTNIPMNIDIWLERYGSAPVMFDTQEIIDNPNFWTEVIEAGSLVVIDEVWKVWPAGLTVKNARQSDKSFIAEHGHMVGENKLSIEIVLVTQDLAQISSFVRLLVETTFRVTKLSKVGADNRFRVDVYSGSVTGQEPPASKRENEFHGKFKQEIYDLYISHTLSEAGAGQDTRTDQRFSIFSGSRIYIFSAAILGFAVFAVYGLNRVRLLYAPSEPLEQETLEPVGQESIRPAQMVEVQQPEVETGQATKQHFLQENSQIYVSKMFGRYPDYSYYFRVVNGSSYFQISQENLLNLGYEVETVDPCLVIVRREDFVKYVGCHYERSGNFLTQAITDR